MQPGELPGFFFGVFMLRPVVAVFDSAVGSYNPPFVVPALGAAVRSFTDEVNRVAEGNSLAAHPEDYHLSVLAMFDDERGTFEVPEAGVRVIVRGKDAVRGGE